jgi:spermidine/putrescine transport system permease protein
VTTIGATRDALAPADRATTGRWRGLFPRMYARWRDPWRPPYVLARDHRRLPALVAAPGLIAALFSFNSGRSRSVWQGFSLRWYLTDPDLSVAHDPSLRTALVHTLVLGVLTTAVSIPLGVAFALGLDRWHGRLPSGANFTMLLSFVIPEITLAVGLLYMVTQLATPFTLGTTAQSSGWSRSSCPIPW